MMELNCVMDQCELGLLLGKGAALWNVRCNLDVVAALCCVIFFLFFFFFLKNFFFFLPYDIWDLTQMVRNLLVMLETQVQALGRNDPLEKEMATHSCILAWRILWTEKPGGLQSMGLQRVMDTTERLTHCGLNQSPLYWRRSVLTAKPPGKSLCHFLHFPSRQPQCWIHGEAFLPPS